MQDDVEINAEILTDTRTVLELSWVQPKEKMKY